MLHFVGFLVILVPFYQACHFCDSCSTVAASESSLCKCDADCGIFGDCCGSLSPPDSCPPPSLNFLLPGVVLECQSIYLNAAISENEGFLMVSSCPSCYEEIQETNGLVRNCSKDILLQPVTDLKTGIVYRNEYCAYCNGVEELLTWQIILICSDNINKVLNLSTVLDNDTTVFHRECRESHFRAPSLPAVSHPRSCLSSVNSCLVKSELEDGTGQPPLVDYLEMEHSCYSGAVDQAVGTDGLVYKNAACAQCNAVNVSYCLNAQNKSQVSKYAALNTSKILRTGSNTSITITTINSTTISIISSNNNSFILHILCSEREKRFGIHCVYTDHFRRVPWNKQVCSGFMKTHNFSSNLSTCILKLLVLSNYTSDIDSQNLACLATSQCLHHLVLLNNGDIFAGGNITATLYYDSHFNLYTCSSHKNIASTILHYIACSLSLAGVIVTIITYTLFKELRTLPSTILLNYTFVIFLTDLTDLFSEDEQFSEIKDIQISFAIFFHYFSLVKVTWMALLSYEILRKFCQGMKLELDSKQSRKRHLVIYILTGWCSAALIVLITVIVDFTTDSLVEYGTNGTKEYTIINTDAWLLAWVLPATILIIFSIVTFCITSYFICKVARERFKLEKTANWTLIRLWIAVLLVSGLPYLFYIVREPEWFVILTDFYSNAEGFIIFLAFLFTKKVLNLYYNLVFCKAEHNS